MSSLVFGTLFKFSRLLMLAVRRPVWLLSWFATLQSASHGLEVMIAKITSEYLLTLTSKQAVVVVA